MQSTSQQQLIVGRMISLEIPRYPFIITVFIAMALLYAGAMIRASNRAQAARASYERTKAQWEAAEASRQELKQRLAKLHNKQTIATLAQEKLHYVAKNEIVVVIK